MDQSVPGSTAFDVSQSVQVASSKIVGAMFEFPQR